MRLLSIFALGACGTLHTYSADDEDLLDGEDDGDDEDGDDRSQSEDRDDDGVPRSEDCDDDDDGIYPGASDVCGDDLDADCDGYDCPGWEEDYESGALRPAWVLDGAALWSVWSTAARQGTYAAVSGPILDSQSSDLGLLVQLEEPGAVSFWHTGSTEASYDLLRFWIDGLEVAAWSGTWAWQEDTFELPAGPHTLRWSYTKDASQSLGQDAVVIDDVSIEGGSP